MQAKASIEGQPAGLAPGLTVVQVDRNQGGGRFAQLADIIRTATFRLAVAFATAFAVSSLLLFAFIYWQTAVYETRRIDTWIAELATSAAKASPEQLMWTVDTHWSNDLHRLTFAALFDRDGRLIMGNLSRVPPGLPADGAAHDVEADLQTAHGPTSERVRAAARRLPDGRLFVAARNIDELVTLHAIVLRALALGVIPAVLLALAAGFTLSARALHRVKVLHQTIERIMRGALAERLPMRGTGDDFDQLAASVNRMLDEIGRLLDEIKGVGDDIAHDLRTPLGRVRARLERSRDTARTHGELQEAIDRAIAGLDQALAIITALLRIGEIEAGQRRQGFAAVDLAGIVAEIGDLYAPIAEERGTRLVVVAEVASCVFGDRELLIELVANLIGNSIKFTPAGGTVRLELLGAEPGPLIRVRDTGPGIPATERDAVLKRFYRSDKSRHVEGSGLGLSLVAAIAKLHGFTIRIGDGTPGCVFELICRSEFAGAPTFGAAAGGAEFAMPP
jgi:signal transduction histidine kinase